MSVDNFFFLQEILVEMSGGHPTRQCSVGSQPFWSAVQKTEMRFLIVVHIHSCQMGILVIKEGAITQEVIQGERKRIQGGILRKWKNLVSFMLCTSQAIALVTVYCNYPFTRLYLQMVNALGKGTLSSLRLYALPPEQCLTHSWLSINTC